MAPDNSHEAARREAAARKLAALEQRAAALDLSDPDEWNANKSIDQPPPARDDKNVWVPPHRRGAGPSAAAEKKSLSSEVGTDDSSPTSARSARPAQQRYMPPRVRKEMEQRE